MAKNTTTAQGFFGSLLLLVVALIVSFFVLLPRHTADVKPVEAAAPATPRPAVKKVVAREEPIEVPPPAEAPAPAPKVEAAKPKKGPDGEDPDVQKAINLIDAGSIQEAVGVLEGVLKRDPKNEQALVELAMIYLLDMKQPDVATGYLQKVVEVNPGNQIVLSELVSLYEEQGRVDEGLGFLQGVQEKNPQSPDLAYGVGQLLTLQGRDADAIDYLQKATQSPENRVRALKDLGEAYARSGDPENAINSLNQAITSQEQEIQDKETRGLPVQFAEERLAYTKMDKARELMQVGDLEQAQQLLNEVKQKMPKDEAVSSLQASLNRRRG